MSSVLIVLLLLATPSTIDTPDFSGYWRLVGQETSAFRGRGSIGNQEEPVQITQTGGRLVVVAVGASGVTDALEYDLTGSAVMTTTPDGGSLEHRSRWDGATLVTRGRRMFTTPDGPRAFGFEEKRRLSTDGRRMTVEMTINMFPQDLKRTSIYERIAGE